MKPTLDKRDPTYGNYQSWDSIATEFIGKIDPKVRLHFLKGKACQIVRLGTGSNKVGSNGAK